MTVLTPRTLEQAVEMIAEHPHAQLLMGGTDFMVEVNFNHRKPDDVIALRQVHELGTWSIDVNTGDVFIGAGVPYAEMEKGTLADAIPALAAAARTVGSPQIRAAGTLGGNLGTCSPAGDGLPVLAALDAHVHLASVEGARTVPFAEFMAGPKRNTRRENEIITGVTIGAADGWQGYSKVGVRNAMVISVASACFAVHRGTARLALGSVGPTIIRCHDAESWLSTQNLTDDTRSIEDIAAEFGSRAAAEARPIDDHRSTAAYRRHAIGVLARRLCEKSVSDTKGAS